VASDVESMREASADELGDEREQPECDACQPSLPVHDQSVPAR
jgi:hypothetical protein